jgi:hypothetical protein
MNWSIVFIATFYLSGMGTALDPATYRHRSSASLKFGLDSYVLVVFYLGDDRPSRKLAHANPKADGKDGLCSQQGVP